MTGSITYRKELDGLRAVAALMVVAVHSGLPALRGGQQGVDVFFVLSGYLITAMLPHMRVGDFYVRRVRRLYPALLLLIAAYLALIPALGWPASDAWMALTYTRNLFLFPGSPDTPLKHTWTLGIEAQFYLIWPVVLPMLARIGQNRLLISAWIFLTILRTIYAAIAGDGAAFLFQPLHITGLLLGAVCATSPRLPHWASWLGFGLIGGHLVASAFGIRSIGLGQAAVELGTALIICAPSRLYRILSVRPLVWLGLISYGIYLWHAPAALLMRGHLWWQTLAIELVAGIGLGAVSYYTVERLRAPRVGNSLKPEFNVAGERSSASSQEFDQSNRGWRSPLPNVADEL